MSYDPTNDPDENAMQLAGGLTPAKPAAKPFDYQGALVSYYDNLSRQLMSSGYGGNAQQSWMKTSTPGASGESAGQYHARTGRISARTAPGPGSGPGGGLTGGVGKTDDAKWDAAFKSSTARPGSPGFIGPQNPGGGLMNPPPPTSYDRSMSPATQMVKPMLPANFDVAARDRTGLASRTPQEMDRLSQMQRTLVPVPKDYSDGWVSPSLADVNRLQEKYGGKTIGYLSSGYDNAKELGDKIFA